MKTTEYLDAAKAKLGIDSDYELAKRLDITRMAISDYRHERRSPDNFTVFRLAVILENDPADMIADLESQREKDEKKAAFFRDFVSRANTLKAATVRTLASIFIAGLLAVISATGSSLEKAGGLFRRARNCA